MADEKTLKEWEKGKRVEAEKMKALRDLNFGGNNKLNLSYLDPVKKKGFTWDPNVFSESLERYGGISLICAIPGVVMSIFDDMIGIESSAFKLGLAGAGLSMTVGIVSSLLIMVASVLAIIVFFGSIFYKLKYHKKIKTSLITSVISISIVAIYYFIRSLLSNMV